MEQIKERYVVAFKKGARGLSDIVPALNADQSRIVDACDYLTSTDKGLAAEVILHLPEIGVIDVALTKMEADKLQLDPRVASLRVNRPIISTPMINTLSTEQVDALDDIPAPAWHVPLVTADKCWSKTTGKGVKVGVIDSEIDKNIPFLPIAGGASFNPDAADWFGTDDFHGTFCAGIVGCRNASPKMIGIAPECDLYALRVNKDGKGSSTYIAAAMIWAARNKFDVVSMSQWHQEGASDPHEPPWDDVGGASDLLVKSGCIAIGIAGNSGSFANPWVTNPGRCLQVVAVGATNRDLSWWNESSYGPDDLQEESAVEIVAPGYEIFSIVPGGGYAYGAGTSFAAPQVAGACALLKQLRPELSPDDLRSRIKEASRDLDPAGRDAKFGVGFLDCFKAVSDLTA